MNQPTAPYELVDRVWRLSYLVGRIEAWANLMDVSDEVRVEKIRGLLAQHDADNRTRAER